jgi:hypothetical protein
VSDSAAVRSATFPAGTPIAPGSRAKKPGETCEGTTRSIRSRASPSCASA